MLSLKLVLDFSRNSCESLLNTGSILSTDLTKENFTVLGWEFLGKLLTFYLSDHSLILKIIFIADDYFGYSWRGFFWNLMNPISQILKRFTVDYWICEYDSWCSFVIGLGDGTISLLTSCVPNLKFDLFVVDC